MRNIPNGELERIAQQNQNRILGTCDIAFQLYYYKNTVTPVIETYWFEDGFKGDFQVIRVESNFRSFPIANTLVETTASLILPLSYSDGFRVRNYEDAPIEAYNRQYRLEKQFSGFSQNDTVTATKVLIKTMNGRPLPPDVPNLYELTEVPLTTVDGVYCRLHNGVVVDNYRPADFPSRGQYMLVKPGLGVTDAYGLIEDIKRPAFRYKTTTGRRF